MKRKPTFLLFLLLMAGLSISAHALGQRGQRPDHPTYHLETVRSLPGEWSALCFANDYPVVIAGDESLQFLRPGGQALKRLPRSRHSKAIFSAGGNFVSVLEIAPLDDDPKAPPPLTFTLYDGDGEKLWSIERSLAYDVPAPAYYVSSKGRVVQVEPPESRITFYDDSGQASCQVRLFPKTEWSNERPMACAFSADGSRFAANALHHNPRPGDELAPRERGQSFLSLFDGRGDELWRRELEGELPGRVAISSDGRVVVAGSYSVRQMGVVDQKTSLYDDEGNVSTRLDFPFRLAAFSDDGGSLLLGQKSDLRLVETATGRVRWQKILSGQIRTLALSSNGDLILALLARGEYRGSRFVYLAPQAFLYDGEGKQIWHGEFPEDSFIQPTAGFLEDGARFFMAFKGRYLIYGQE